MNTEPQDRDGLPRPKPDPAPLEGAASPHRTLTGGGSDADAGQVAADPDLAVADPGPAAGDTGSAVADPSLAARDAGPAVAGTGPAAGDTGSAVADPGLAAGDAGRAVAGTGSVAGDTDRVVADTGRAAGDRSLAAGDAGRAVAGTGRATGDTGQAVADTGRAAGDPDLAEESLASLLGGRRAAIDATLGPVAFAVAYFVTGRSVGWAAVAAIGLSAGIAAWRLTRGDKPRAVLLGLLGVVLAALVALRTGHAEDFFVIRIVTNAASALTWTASIVIRWPLLGVIVGTVLGQKGHWRHDPALLRAYSRGSWVWVGQYLVRIIIWVPMWWAGMLGALAASNLVLTWPLVAVCLAASWWVIQRTLPPTHPGIRHPQTTASLDSGTRK